MAYVFVKLAVKSWIINEASIRHKRVFNEMIPWNTCKIWLSNLSLDHCPLTTKMCLTIIFLFLNSSLKTNQELISGQSFAIAPVFMLRDEMNYWIIICDVFHGRGPKRTKNESKNFDEIVRNYCHQRWEFILWVNLLIKRSVFEEKKRASSRRKRSIFKESCSLLFEIQGN